MPIHRLEELMRLQRQDTLRVLGRTASSASASAAALGSIRLAGRVTKAMIRIAGQQPLDQALRTTRDVERKSQGCLLNPSKQLRGGEEEEVKKR